MGRRVPTAEARVPVAEWSWYSSAPLVGCRLLRECHWVLAWDDTHTLYLLDRNGQEIARKRAPRELAAVDAADTGTRIVAASRKGEIWWLDDQLAPQLEVRCQFAPLAVAVDPHGQYVAVSSDDNRNAVFTAQGKAKAAYDTSRPLKHLAFVPLSGNVVGAADNGLVTCDTYRGRNIWYETQWSNVGGLCVSGSGDKLLLSCYGHGVARYNTRGRREGAYRQEDSPALVAIDFDGTTILTASLEKRLTLLDSSGAVRGFADLDHVPIAIQLDASARYAVLAFPHGEIRRLATESMVRGQCNTRRSGIDAAVAAPVPGQMPGTSQPNSPPAGRATRAPGGPAISFKAVPFDEDARGMLLSTVPGTDGVAFLDTHRQLRVVSASGELLHRGSVLRGVGGVFRIARTWLAAGTDLSLVAYYPHINESHLFEEHTYELSHFALFDDPAQVVLVEGSTLLIRYAFGQGRLWQRPAPGGQVLALAVAPSGEIAVTIDEAGLQLLDVHGDPLGGFETRRPAPLDVHWLHHCFVTISRDENLVRGHDRDGQLLWATNTPWMVWKSLVIGQHLVLVSVRGQSVLIDENGAILAKNDEERDQLGFAQHREGGIVRIYANQQTLLATQFDGRLLWRYTFDKLLGPFAAGPAGIWAFNGNRLQFFPWP